MSTQVALTAISSKTLAIAISLSSSRNFPSLANSGRKEELPAVGVPNARLIQSRASWFSRVRCSNSEKEATCARSERSACSSSGEEVLSPGAAFDPAGSAPCVEEMRCTIIFSFPTPGLAGSCFRNLALHESRASPSTGPPETR